MSSANSGAIEQTWRIALQPGLKSSGGRRAPPRSPRRTGGRMLAQRQDAIVEHAAHVDQLAPALAAQFSIRDERRLPALSDRRARAVSAAPAGGRLLRLGER